MLEKARVSFFLASRSITRGNKGITVFTVFVLTLIFVQLVLFSSILAGVQYFTNWIRKSSIPITISNI